MVQDNPYLEVWRSLSLDQTELNIFGKWSRLDQNLGKWSSPHWLTFIISTFLKLNLCGHWWQRGREIHKNSKIRGENKWNDIVRGLIKIWSTQVGEQAHKLVCCIWMCITYVCLHGTSSKFLIHACVVHARL